MSLLLSSEVVPCLTVRISASTATTFKPCWNMNVKTTGPTRVSRQGRRRLVLSQISLYRMTIQGESMGRTGASR